MDKKLMHTSDGQSESFAQMVVDGALVNQEHVGKRLLESLHPQIARRVRESDFNPAHIDRMEYEDVVNWLNDHVVFDFKGQFVGLFDGSEWLWEADKG